MTEKKKIRFTLVDALVLIVIIAVALFVGSKLFGGDSGTGAQVTKTYIVSYYFEEVPDFAANNIEIGSLASDEAKNIPLGTVASVEIGEAATYYANSEGMAIKSAKEGYNSVKLTLEVDAQEFDHGIMVDDGKYVVGHTMTLYAGKSKLYGRISGIEEQK